MASRNNWSDDYWLLLLQIYLRKPVGVKPTYSRVMVKLSLDIHVHPQSLHDRMRQIARLDTPRLEHIWNTFADNPRKLTRAVKLLRTMSGFGNAEEFYDGVEVNETFERDFRPLEEQQNMTPMMLIIILDLYFRLTPATMVSETPEVAELARLMKIPIADVVDALDVFQHCDPFLDRQDVTFSPLLLPCQEVWERYGNADTNQLSRYANDLKAFFA